MTFVFTFLLIAILESAYLNEKEVKVKENKNIESVSSTEDLDSKK